MKTNTTTTFSTTFTQLDTDALAAVQGGFGISDLENLGKKALNSVSSYYGNKRASGLTLGAAAKGAWPYARGLASQVLSKATSLARSVGTTAVEDAPTIASDAADVAETAAEVA